MSEQIKKITGLWTLKNAYMPKDRGTVFSCFACAGGSTMGYKLAGFDVIGANEIDPKVAAVYKLNHKPKYLFVSSIRDFLNHDEIPDELYQLDILDGSPPCTSFSTAGKRERDWGKIKQFSEGQALQRLDDLFFEFIALAKKLKPKIVISENVTGIIRGKAKGYVKEINQGFSDAGYDTQIFKLNAATMGVPQARERIFFISRRKDLGLKKIKLSFNEKPIKFKQVCQWIEGKPDKYQKMADCYKQYFQKATQGKSISSVHPTGSYFSARRWSMEKPAPTLVCGATDGQLHPYIERIISENEWLVCGSFPLDMKFKKLNPKWAVGMSVPPFMIQRIAIEIYKQWLS